jgi:uncharacterized protein (DUF885 family)
MRMSRSRIGLLSLIGLVGLMIAVLLAAPAAALSSLPGAPASAAPDEEKMPPSEMEDAINRYVLDRGSLSRFYNVQMGPERRARMKKFYEEWRAQLAQMKFEAMSQTGRVDYILFRNHLDHELKQLEIEVQRYAEVEPIVPFAGQLMALEETRRRMEKIDTPRLATELTQLARAITAKRQEIEGGLRGGNRPAVKKTVANRAAALVSSLRFTLRNWYTYYNGYDPIFTWWAEEPYKAVDQALGGYATFLTERVVGTRSSEAGPTMAAGGGRGVAPGAGGSGGGGQGGQRGGFGGGGNTRGTDARPGDASDIIGDPIGREALQAELSYEMVPYTPEDLISLARKEYAWCEAEMRKASRDLGYGDDWLKALEYVKTQHVEPGKQPELIRELALEAINFVEKKNLVTVPPLARESWRMEMMTPERQLIAPFFLGGEVIQVSFPTNTMTHEQKMMSMRGNNIHFSRATVHHELIPGHHLQGFMTARYRPYRSLFSTPFSTEGWALYWEFLLWDLDFQNAREKGPENRIGMLFWRMHRCARIIFSLGFHLEQMTPQECIDLLVKGVGHEVENATAEVRRSFAGDYGPLYQCAYMLGGLQYYALHRDLVKSGKMTDRAFHDALLKENRIPVEMARAILTNQPLTRDFKTNWRFYDR